MIKKIEIIGAGIAGLTTALCLAKKGFNVTIYEKSKQLEEVGAGVQLSPNATYILKKLNLLDECIKKAVQPTNINLIDGYSLECLTSLPIKQYTEQNNLTEYLTIHRGDLQKILLNEVMQSNLITLHLNVKTTILQKNTINIAADGIWSATRNDKSIYSGFVAWRTTIDSDKINIKQNEVQAYLGAKNHIIAYPICSGSKYNIVAITPYKILTDKISIQSLFKTWHKNIRNILTENLNYSLWPIYTMPYEKFNENNTILIGDASHGFLPFAAQGAGMAIEDAFILSDILEKSTNIKRAIELYKSQRLNRLKTVKNRGALNARAYHATGITRFIRNMILKNTKPLTLLEKLDWLYKYKV